MNRIFNSMKAKQQKNKQSHFSRNQLYLMFAVHCSIKEEMKWFFFMPNGKHKIVIISLYYHFEWWKLSNDLIRYSLVHNTNNKLQRSTHSWCLAEFIAICDLLCLHEYWTLRGIDISFYVFNKVFVVTINGTIVKCY